jgi:hypothetical protein
MDKPWKVILAFLGVFVAGAVFGGFFSLGIGRKIWEIEAPAIAASKAVPPPVKQAAADGAKEKDRDRKSALFMPQSVQSAQMMRRITNQLNLTAEQKASVTPIIQHALQDIWRQQQNLYRETTYLTQRMKEDIARELTPEQQKQLDDLWSKALEQFRKRAAEAQAQQKAEAQQRRANKGESGEGAKSSPGEAKEPSSSKPSTEDPN